jgi:hypothetical protein
MDKDDRVIRDMFLNNYGIFRSYERMAINPEEKDPDAEDKLSWRLDVMANVDDLYASAKAYSRLITSDPEKFGFKKEDLKKKIEAIDDIVMDIYEEKDKYSPPALN